MELLIFLWSIERWQGHLSVTVPSRDMNFRLSGSQGGGGGKVGFRTLTATALEKLNTCLYVTDYTSTTFPHPPFRPEPNVFPEFCVPAYV